MTARPAVLLVDDVPLNLELLADTLGDLDCDLLCAEGGERAIEMMKTRELAVALLDIQMPVIDGYEVARRMRADLSTRDVPIVFLTATPNTEEMVLRGYGAGAIDYLWKPFNATVLRSKVCVFCDLYLARRRLADTNDSLREAYEQLKEAESGLVQAEKLASLGQMVAGVAHEINNPLAFVHNNVAVLERDLRGLREVLSLYRRADDKLAQHDAELLREIQAASERIDLEYTLANLDRVLGRSREGLDRIRQIVRDLRDFARLDEHEIAEVDLNAGITSTVNIAIGRAKQAGVEIELDLGVLRPISCHPARINQVVLNLIANAIDASTAGGKVIVRSRADEGGATIDVIDHGAGIDPSIRGRLFDPFFTTKPPGAGTGLGLSISYGIVRDHGGSIEVDSAPGRGACFRVRLPARSR
jgi:signal transduction histidine kinase